ncbi:MAG: hypothetical protein QGF56_06400, partial [Verrucomicrobiota bacterium]|nr:hypothetical protein [Verrucomicrobiota bacterium]
MKKRIFNNWNRTAIAVAATIALGLTARADDSDVKVFWKDSLRLETEDGNNKFRLGGRIHWDNAFTPDDAYMSDGDVFRRTRLYVSGQIRGRYDF